MKKFIVSLSKDNKTKYLLVDPASGHAVATDLISSATIFRFRQHADLMIKCLRPIFDRDCPGLDISVISVQ